jgi:homoserine dehydrogenase
MEAENLSFGVALEGAQARGYAEADPTADIEGHDTAHKLALMAALAFGTAPNLEDVTIEGIQRVTPVDFLYAARLGYRIKLLGVAHLTDEGLEQRVGPCLVPLESPLARVDDVLNAAQIEGDAVGALTLIGRGAGGRPTASAVIGDLVDLARGTTVLPFGVRVRDLRALPASPPDKRVGEWYVRLHVKDQPGVVAEVSAILRDEAISIESLLQHGRSETREVPVIITTHAVDEASLRRASRRIGQLSVVREEPFCLKIERPEYGA